MKDICVVVDTQTVMARRTGRAIDAKFKNTKLHGRVQYRFTAQDCHSHNIQAVQSVGPNSGSVPPQKLTASFTLNRTDDIVTSA